MKRIVRILNDSFIIDNVFMCVCVCVCVCLYILASNSVDTAHYTYQFKAWEIHIKGYSCCYQMFVIITI